MKLYRSTILCTSMLCTAAMLALAARPAWATPPASIVADQPVEIAPVSACDCGDVPAPCGSPFSVYVPNQTPGLEFTGGFLLLQPGADNLGFATITTFLPIQNPQWAVQTIDPDYQPGFNVGARYVFPCSGRDISANWDHLRTHDSTFVPVDDLATQWISPFSQTGPSTSETANEVGIFHLKSAAGRVDFDYDRADFDVGQTVNIGPNTQFRLFAGLSCVWLKQQLVSTFYNDPNIDPVPPVVAPANPDLQYITLDNTSTYTGLGPRVGLTTEYNLFRRWTFVSQLSGAVLAGSMQPAQYSFAGIYDERVDSEQITSRSVSQVVYAADAKLGLGYTWQFQRGSILSFESGFKAALYVNPFSTYETSTNVLPLDIGSLSTNSMRHTPSNFTLNGFYANCSLLW